MTEDQTLPAAQPETTGTEPAATPAAEPVLVAGVVEVSDGIATAVTLAASGDTAVLTGIVADEDGVLAEGAIGVQGEYAIIVASFADMDLAKEAYGLLLAAESAGRLDIEGVLVASADEAGKVHIVKMTDHKTRNGFLAGAVAGAVVGIIFPPAILASALWVGVGGAAIGKLRNIAARSAAAKELASVLVPGSSGIIALARLAEVAEVEKELPKATAVKAAPVSDEVAAAVKEVAKEAGAAPEGQQQA
ncbi:MAG TPA: DUF1269 domain-containing protein [Candidatus Limnocylindrales bacterium]|nr:DUF1269 domain-containing protein [Candidatus Limnocylindrales bacterium]